MKEIVIIGIQAICIFLVPFLIIRFRNNKLTKWIGTIGMAYLLGIILHSSSFYLKDGGRNFTQ